MFSAEGQTARLIHGKQTANMNTRKHIIDSASQRINPAVADIATISIGGNDIGFYNILTACVLWVGGYWAGDCDTEIAKAYEVLANPDLAAGIASALTEIISKNGEKGFKIYMTGYVTFFNETTSLCESSSFRIYNPHYDSTHKEEGQPFLTMALRKKLNDVVMALNAMLNRITDSVNSNYADAQKVVFVDPNPAYAGHRWCEEGVYEPDNDRLDTWLFLSSSPDNNLPDNPRGALESYEHEMSQQLAGPNFSLPDPTTCRESPTNSNSAVDSDWYGKSPGLVRLVATFLYLYSPENILCDISAAATKNSSLERQVIIEDALKIQNNNLTELRIPWYVPTKLAKTFHPKTLGQQAFANEIMSVW